MNVNAFCNAVGFFKINMFEKRLPAFLLLLMWSEKKFRTKSSLVGAESKIPYSPQYKKNKTKKKKK